MPSPFRFYKVSEAKIEEIGRSDFCKMLGHSKEKGKTLNCGLQIETSILKRGSAFSFPEQAGIHKAERAHLLVPINVQSNLLAI